MSSLDWSVVGGYLALIVAIGLWQKRKASGSTEDFYVSGRKLPWWIAGTSMIAASFATDTPLAVSGWVRSDGIWKNWIWWSLGISWLLTTFFFSRLWRRTMVLTEVELAELRYSGRGAAVLRGSRAVYWGVIYNCFTLGGLILTGLTKVVKGTTGIEDPTTLVILCGTLGCAYAVLSGLWGVVATDFFQFVLAIFGSLALAWFSVQAAGGWGNAVAAAPPERLEFFPSPGTGFFTAFLGYVLVQWWAWKNSDGGGIVVQRMAACRDERHAVGASLWFSVFHHAVRGWPWIIVGVASFSVLPAIQDPELIYPAMIAKTVPSGLRGLLIGWFLAEFMCSISTQTVWGSSMLVGDLYRRFLKTTETEAHYVTVGRVATVGVMLGAVMVALLMTSVRQSFEIILGGTAALGVVLILRWLWWRVNAWTELVVMVTSPLATFWWWPKFVWPDVVRPLGFPENPLVKLAASVAAGLLPALLVTGLTKPASGERLEAFYRRVRPPGPGWRRIAARCPDVTSDLRIPRILGLWLLSVAGVFGLMYSVYALLFHRAYALPAGGGALLALAAVVMVVWRKN